jgi:hypothetical protein
MRWPGLFLAVSSAFAAAAAARPASPAPAPPPALVRAILADLGEDSKGVSASRVRRGLKPVDLDGDGRADHQFDKQALGPGWCGTGGCWLQLWLDRGAAPPLKIFDGQVREVGFRTVRGARIVDLDLHGSACHTFGAHECPVSFRWDGGLGRLVEAATRGGTGVVRFLAPVEGMDGTPPAAVAAAAGAAIEACTRAGGNASEGPSPMTVPDVDGDGTRDWVLPEFYCDLPEGASEPAPGMTLFASAGRPAQPVLAATAPRLDIDVASTPAAVFAVDLASCSEEDPTPKPCRRTRLAWNPATKRFVATR